MKALPTNVRLRSETKETSLRDNRPADFPLGVPGFVSEVDPRKSKFLDRLIPAEYAQASLPLVSFGKAISQLTEAIIPRETEKRLV